MRALRVPSLGAYSSLLLRTLPVPVRASVELLIVAASQTLLTVVFVGPYCHFCSPDGGEVVQPGQSHLRMHSNEGPIAGPVRWELRSLLLVGQFLRSDDPLRVVNSHHDAAFSACIDDANLAAFKLAAVGEVQAAAATRGGHFETCEQRLYLDLAGDLTLWVAYTD